MEHKLKTAVGGEETLKKSTQKEGKGVLNAVQVVIPRRKRSWAELAWEVMHNELVVRKIAEKLPTRGLLDLRETCSLWNTKFIPEVQTKHETILLNWSKDPWPSKRVRGAFDFANVFKSSSKIPFTRFHSSSIWGSLEHDRLARYKMHEFIEVFGKNITILHFSWSVDDLPMKQLLRRLIFELTPALSELVLEPYYGGPHSPTSTDEEDSRRQNVTIILPKLRRIRVKAWIEEYETLSPDFTQLVSDTIQSASELEFLQLHDYGSRPWENFVRVNLASLLNDTNQLKIHKLKTLVLGNFDLEELKILAQLARQGRNSLQLHTFQAKIESEVRWGSDEYLETITFFHTFLKTQSPTLKCFELGVSLFVRPDQYGEIPFRIPQMVRLTHLRIINWGSVGALPREEIVFGDTVGPDSFVETFPALRNFSCYVTDDLDRLYHPKVEELELDIDNFRNLIRCGTIFPSLTRLELNLPKRMDLGNYSCVWTVWPNLTVFHLTGTIDCSDMDFDSFLTGVPRLKLFKAMMQELTSSISIPTDSSSTMLDTLHSILDKYKTEPGIRDLKQLHELKIRTYGEKMPKYRWHRLTDIGGYFGIGLASPCLKRVLINGRAKNLVSEKCHAFIRSIFGLGLEIMF